MARWTGTWLSGLGAAGVSLRSESDYRGARLGLPEDGPGSVATFGRRLVAFVLDAMLCGLVAGLFTAPEPPRLWSLVPFAVLYAVGVPLTGQTAAMRLLRMRVERLGGRPADVPRAVVRLVLLALLVPALFVDRDGRGLHDRMSGTLVVRV